MYPPAIQLKGLPTNWNGMLAITDVCPVMTFSAKLPPDICSFVPCKYPFADFWLPSVPHYYLLRGSIGCF